MGRSLGDRWGGAAGARPGERPAVGPALDHNWLVVAGAFGASFVAFLGLFNYGIFLDTLTEELDAGKGLTAAVFSLTTFVYYLSGILAGRLADRYGPRPVIAASAMLVGTGFVLGSRAQSVGQLALIWALTLGPGVGASYSPLVAAVGAWFDRRRALALGVALSGAGAGILAGAPICSFLLRAYGWRTAFVVLGVGSALVLGACAVTASRPRGLGHAAPTVLGPLLRTRTFRLMFLAVALLSLAFFTPFVFLASYAEDHGIGPATTSVLVGLIGATSTVGRLVLATVGGGLGEVRMYQLSHALMAGSFAVWLFAGSSAAALAVFSVLMGTGYGGFVALAPAVLAREFGPERLGGLIGTLYSAFAIGSATSPPLVGWLTDSVGAAPGIAFALVAATGALAATMGLDVDRPSRSPVGS
jgi:MFS family permease